MLSTIEVESIAHQALDRIAAKQQVEDSRVEAKTEWSVDKRHLAREARQLAGHINASRGEPVLWLIGANERRGEIVGVEPGGLRGWWDSLSKWFDDPPPAPVDRVVHRRGKAVVVLEFDSSYTAQSVAMPVHNPSGEVVGRSDRYEIPWRTLTEARSASRRELLAMLIPTTIVPVFEPLQTTVTLSRRTNESQPVGSFLRWQVEMSCYVDVPLGAQTAIPFHRCAARLTARGAPLVVQLTVKLSGPAPSQGMRRMYQRFGQDLEEFVHLAETGDDQLLIFGPGPVNVRGFAEVEDVPQYPELAAAGELEVSFDLLPVQAEQQISIDTTVLIVDGDEPGAHERGRVEQLLTWRQP